MSPAGRPARRAPAQPYRLAAGLAGATVGGLVGMMVTAGMWDWAFLGLAAVPAAIGLAGYLRRRAR